MDYRKIDASLVTAIGKIHDAEKRTLTVFIHTMHPPKPEEVRFLEKFDVRGTTNERRVFTASLSVNEVEELSDQPWVQYIKMSRKIRLLND